MKRVNDINKQHTNWFIKVVLLMVLTIVAVIGGCVYVTTTVITANGGVSQIMIDAGKEIKTISAEIDKFDPDAPVEDTTE